MTRDMIQNPDLLDPECITLSKHNQRCPCLENNMYLINVVKYRAVNIGDFCKVTKSTIGLWIMDPDPGSGSAPNFNGVVHSLSSINGKNFVKIGSLVLKKSRPQTHRQTNK